MLTTQQIGLAKQAGLFIFESVLYFFTVFQWCVEREPFSPADKTRHFDGKNRGSRDS